MSTHLAIRNQFPFIRSHPEFIYLDNAATSLKPDPILDRITRFYHNETANIHRGTHVVAESATIAFENARTKIGQFINADSNEIVFTLNASYAINLLAKMLDLDADHTIIGSILEHHSNRLPWEAICQYHALPIDQFGVIQTDSCPDVVLERAKIMVINYVSNVTGTIQPIRDHIRWAKGHGLVVVLDASQAIAHLPIDVKELEVDFMIFSGHKMYGPSGVGILYGKYQLLRQMRPILTGGGMMQKVSDKKSILKPIPHCFEAGTPNIESVIGLGAAVQFLCDIGWENIRQHQEMLKNRMTEVLKEIWFLEELVEGRDRIPLWTLFPKGYGPDVHLLGRLLSDQYGILTTSGQQCAHPLYESFSLDGGIRFSCGIYSQSSEIEKLGEALRDIQCMFRPKRA